MSALLGESNEGWDGNIAKNDLSLMYIFSDLTYLLLNI